MAEKSIVLTTDRIDQESDEIKIIKAVRQNPEAFGELYGLYVEKVFRYLYSRIGNVHEAEDATSQTFLAAFETFGRFRQDGHFASWLFTMARNKAMDHFRERKKSVSLDDVEEISAPGTRAPYRNRDYIAGTGTTSVDDPLYGVIQSEQSAALSKLILALPEEDRELLRLRFLAGMSFPEIAYLLHRNEEAVKKSIYRLLARLHSQMEVSNG